MTTTAIIPARGGSKRLPGKNLIDLAGRPLIAWTIRQARDAQCVDNIVVSTDDYEIAQVAAAEGAGVLHRPEELAGDNVSSEAVLAHAIYSVKPERVIFLQPTSPIRQAGDIDAAVGLLERGWADSVYSACTIEGYRHRFANSRRDDCGAVHLIENGSIYVFTSETFRRTQSRFGKHPAAYEMDPLDSYQVDTSEDLERIRAIWPVRMGC